MATVTMTAVDNILKEVYEDRLRDQLETSNLTLKRVEKTSEGVSEDVGGKYVRFSIRTARNQGMGARLEMEALPAGRPQKYETAQVKLTYQYGAIELSGQIFELAERNPQAFASALDQEINGLRDGLKKDMNRQVYGTSVGKMATANAIGTTTTLVMAASEALYMEIGIIFDLYDNTNTLKAGGTAKEVTNIQAATPAVGSTTVTFITAATAATAVGDYIVRTSNRAKEIIGFREIVGATGVLYNIDSSLVPTWRSAIDSPGAQTALSEGRMTAMCDQIRTNGGDTTVMFTSLGVRRSYFNLLSQQRQYVNTTDFTGGFRGLAFTTDDGDIPVISDLHCPWNTMFFMNEKELKLYQAGDWSWMNRDGSNWQRVLGIVGGTAIAPFDAYQTMLYKYCQLGTHRRNSHGIMTNITEA